MTVSLLAGCSGGSQELDLGGREFTSTEVRGHSLVDGTSVRLTFDETAVSAQAGCNTIFGGASWGDGVLTSDGPLAMTMMGCDEDLAAQDQWLSDFLASEPSIALDGGTLVLGDDTEGITLTEVG
ncbi:META domain-containing protein [Ornithinimicrobium sp. LYQ103]|uniref:META domain-containing protein n=1 Tax=Ornithinimicrobium sp. LYQ103 TaxID=3378796 RepID=UPI0038536941